MQWTVFTDGGARGNPGLAASAFVVINEKDEVIFEQGRFIGNTTNNIAEYTAVVDALCYLVNKFQTQELKPTEIVLKADSELVVEQLSGRYKVKNGNLKQLVEQINLLKLKLPPVNFVHVRRMFNTEADALVNQALDTLKKISFHEDY